MAIETLRTTLHTTDGLRLEVVAGVDPTTAMRDESVSDAHLSSRGELDGE